MSSNVILQQQVLSLLAQLIKLRVNYSLLDADQVSRVQTTTTTTLLLFFQQIFTNVRLAKVTQNN